MKHPVGPDDLMRLLDGELPDDQRAPIEQHIRECTECGRDFVIFQRMKGDVRAMASDHGTGPSIWDAVSRRIFRPTGWLLLLAGSLLLTAWGIYSYLTSPEELWSKLATGAVLIGFLLLLLSAVLDRVTALKTDRYREIER